MPLELGCAVCCRDRSDSREPRARYSRSRCGWPQSLHGHGPKDMAHMQSVCTCQILTTYFAAGAVRATTRSAAAPAPGVRQQPSLAGHSNKLADE